MIPNPSKLFYGWWIVIAGSISYFVVSGVAVYGFSAFVKPIHEEMGWSVAAISVAASIRSFQQGMLAPVTGYLVDRLGSRTMAVAGALLLALGTVVFANAYEPWTLWVSAGIIALATSTGPFTPFTAATVAWFSKSRGKAMGMLNTGNGLGYVAVPILVTLIATFGWRIALYFAAASVLVICLPLAFVVRSRPEPFGYLPDGERMDEAALEVQRARTRNSPAQGEGMEVRTVLHIPAFYLLTIGNGLLFGAHNAWLVHQVVHLQNVGFSATVAGLLVGFYGVAQVLIRMIVGWGSDIIGRRRMYILSFFLQAIGFMLFAFLTRDRIWILPIYILMYGLGNAGTVVLSQTVVADYFGTRRFATLRGLSQSVQMPMGIATPILAGWMFDTTGDYTFIFVAISMMMIAGGVSVLLVRRPEWNALPAAETATV